MLKITVLVSLVVTHSIVSSEYIFKGFDSKFKPDWWQSGIIYQIYVKSFKDSDGDGIGDINGIIEKVDYLKSINIGAVWLTPVYKSPQNDGGYDVSSFKEIDPIFGTLADLDRLREVLHQNGIKIIMDFVPNHTSDDHQWFKYSVQRKHPYTDFYVWKDPKFDENGNRRPPNNWLGHFNTGSAWEWNEQRQQYYYHAFHVKQPDLNYRCPAVIEEIKSTILFWLMRGIDGFRMDAIHFLYEREDLADEPKSNVVGCLETDFCYLDHIHIKDQPENIELVRIWRETFDEFSKSENKSTFLTVETYSPINITMMYYGNDTSPGAHFPFNFLFVRKLPKELEFDLQSDANIINDIIKTWMLNMPENQWPNWVIGNHDNARLATRRDPMLVDGLHMMQTLLPGTPTTYNGDELGMKNTIVRWDQTVDTQGLAVGISRYTTYSRDGCRTPIPWDDTINAGFTNGTSSWLPVSSDYWQLNVEQLSKHKSNLRTYRQLAHLRQNPSFVKGDLHTYVISKWVFGFSRSFADHPTFFIVINFGSDLETVNIQAVRESLPDILKVKVSSTNSGYVTGNSLYSKHIVMRPKAGIVLSTERN